MKKGFRLLIVIIWLIMIFIFSNMNATKSSYNSKLLLSKILVFKGEMTEFRRWHHIFRKMLHVMEYCLLSILLLVNIRKNKKRYVMTFILGVIYAISDEYHQTFIMGRCGRIKDIFIDSIGLILGIIISYLGNLLIFNRLVKKKE